MANWGSNLNDSLGGVNPYLRRNSVVTTMYNYFGYSIFSKFLPIWEKQGLISKGWTTEHAPLIRTFNHGIKENIWQHSHIEALAKYSRFVKFVIMVRTIFALNFVSIKRFSLVSTARHCS